MENPHRSVSGSSFKLAFGLLAIALILITLGIVRQEVLVVLQKATFICLECVGLA